MNKLSKEEFVKRYLENQIIEEFKDSFTNTTILRKKFNGLDLDFARINRIITNYQINTYGTQLIELKVSLTEWKRIARNEYYRRINNGKK